MKDIKRLSDAELKIMLAVWEMESPVSRIDLSAELEKYKWQDAVLLTMLSRLCKKGFLVTEKTNGKNYYTPLVSRDEYMEVESRAVIEGADGKYIQNLMSAFIKSEKLTANDIRDIEKMIQEYKERNIK